MAQTKVFGITIGKKTTAPKPAVNQAPPVIAEFIPSLPTVNALPLKIREGYQEKALIKKFAAGAVALAVLFAGMYGFSLYNQAQHKSEIDQLSVTSATLNKSITVLQPYDSYKVNVGGKITTLSSYLSKDVDAAKIVKILFNAADANGITFTTVSLSITGDDGKSSCPSTDPFNAIPTIGCISIAGNQPDSASVNNFFNQIGSTQGFVNVFVAGSNYSTTGDAKNTFTGSVAFTSALHSNKFSNYSLPIDILLKNGLDAAPGTTTGGTATSPATPVAPKPTSTPTASPTGKATSTPTPNPTGSGTPTPNPTSTQGNG